MQESTKRKLVMVLIYAIVIYFVFVGMVMGWSEIFQPVGDESVGSIGGMCAVLACISFPILSNIISKHLIKSLDV